MIPKSLCLILMKSWPASAAVQSWAVRRILWHVNFQRVLWNRIISALKEPHCAESATPEILKVSSWSFFWKCWKFYVDLKNLVKSTENVFYFKNKCVGNCCINFCLLWQEYMWSAVDMLKDAPNISDWTKRHDTQITLFGINAKLAYRCSSAQLSSV